MPDDDIGRCRNVAKMNLVAFVFLINFITRSRLIKIIIICIIIIIIIIIIITIIIIIIIITIYERALEVGKEEYL